MLHIVFWDPILYLRTRPETKNNAPRGNAFKCRLVHYKWHLLEHSRFLPDMWHQTSEPRSAAESTIDFAVLVVALKPRNSRVMAWIYSLVTTKNTVPLDLFVRIMPFSSVLRYRCSLHRRWQHSSNLCSKIYVANIWNLCSQHWYLCSQHWNLCSQHWYLCSQHRYLCR